MKLALDAHSLLQRSPVVLHFAPENCVKRYVKPRSGSYVGADLGMKDVDVHLDITELGMREAAVDLAICIHILEHVDDDRAALKEVARVIRPGGVLVVMVPMVEGWSQTYDCEDASTPESRTLHYGQGNHLRYYGLDFRQRLATAGFLVEEYVAEGGRVVDFGLRRGERVFVCRRLQGRAPGAERA